MKTPLSISIISWVTNAVFWLLIIISILIMVQNMYAWGLINYAVQTHLSFPIDPELIDLQSITLNEVNTPIHINRAFANIEYTLIDKLFLRIYNGGSLLLVIILIFWWSGIRNLMNNVKQNVIFSYLNVKLIKHAAYGMFLAWVVNLLLTFYHKWYFDLLNPVTIDFTKLFFDNYFVFGVAILALAYVFESGVKLQNDQNLTI